MCGSCSYVFVLPCVGITGIYSTEQLVTFQAAVDSYLLMMCPSFPTIRCSSTARDWSAWWCTSGWLCVMYRKSLPVLRQHQGLHNTPLKPSSCALQQYCHPCPAVLPPLSCNTATCPAVLPPLPCSTATCPAVLPTLPCHPSPRVLPLLPGNIATCPAVLPPLPHHRSIATPAQQYCHLSSSIATCPAVPLSRHRCCYIA